MNIDLQESTIINVFRKLNYNDLIIFFIPFYIFSFYLFVFDPGILTFDSYYQLYQIATSSFTNVHPFFHTFIEMLCLKIYPSPISICFFQIIIFSTMWMVVCKYFRQDNSLERLILNKHFILQVLITLVISLIPINALYSITLWKDILFSYCLFFLCFLIKVMIDKEGHLDLKFIFTISLIMACIAQLRHNGFYVILILLIVLAIYLYKKNKDQNVYIVIPMFTIIFILLIASLNVGYDVQDNQKDAFFTKMSHMLADYDLNQELSDSDAVKLHEMMDEESIQENFDITYTDPIYTISNKTVYDNDKNAYLSMAIKYSLQNPIHFIEYIFGSAPIVWDVVKKDNWTGHVYSTDISSARSNFYKGHSINESLANYAYVMPKNQGSPQYNALNSFADYVKDNVILDTLCDSPALYMYLAFIVLIAIVSLTKSKDMLLIYLPNMLNILVVFVSIPVQDNGYLYSNLLVFYLLLIFLISFLINSNKDNSSTTFNVLTKNDKSSIKRINGPNKSSSDEMKIFPENSKQMVRNTYFDEETPEEVEMGIRSEILMEIENELQNKR